MHKKLFIIIGIFIALILYLIPKFVEIPKQKNIIMKKIHSNAYNAKVKLQKGSHYYFTIIGSKNNPIKGKLKILFKDKEIYHIDFNTSSMSIGKWYKNDSKTVAPYEIMSSELSNKLFKEDNNYSFIIEELNLDLDNIKIGLNWLKCDLCSITL